jgi:glycosyltransferase involved in cell wall biosynthesis
MKTKKVSVIITNYNRGKLIDRAIRSCFDQVLFTGIKLEVIVVDDASTDNSIKILEMYGDSIILVKHFKNMGVSSASNSGIKKATGDFIIRLDADDFLNKMSIFIITSILTENKDIDFVYTDHFRVDNLGFKEKKVKLDTMEMLFEHGAGVMFRRKVFSELGGYDEKLKNCEDYDLLIRVVSKYKGYYLPLALYRYHINGDNLTLKDEREMYKKIVRERHGI